MLACARGEVTDADRQSVDSAAARVTDWDDFLDLAEAHGLGHFAARHQPAAVPQACARRIRREVQTGTARALLLLDCQWRVAAELDRAGVPHVWLKGLALSEQLYGQIEARRCLDLDLLTTAADVPNVEACLSRLGLTPYRDPRPGKDEHFMNAHHRTWQWPVSAGRSLFVEVHHRLPGPVACQPCADEILQRSRSLALKGMPVRVPSHEDELLILCLHAHHHNYSLRQLVDVAEYVKRFGAALDGAKFLALARRHRARGKVSAALVLADRALGCGVKGPWQATGWKLTPWQRRVMRGLSEADLCDAGADGDDARRLRLALLADGWGDVLRLLGPHFWPARDYLKALYPNRWGRIPGAARGYHFFRLMSRHRHGP